MKKYKDKDIFELMKVPTEKLKELTIEEFAKEINNKLVNIEPIENNNYCSEINGDIYVIALHAHIYIRKYVDGYKMHMYGDSNGRSSFSVWLSENLVFGIYSYENDHLYRIAFEGNSHDLLISIWDIDRDYKKFLKEDIRALIQKYEYERKYDRNYNTEIITETLNELKKLIE